MSSVLLRASLALAASLLATGCGPDFVRMEFVSRNTPPGQAQANSAGIDIETGIALGVIAIPIDDNGEEMDEDTDLELVSENESILGVGPSIENHTFVFYGVSPGTTNVTMFVDGDFKGQLPANVIRQEAP